MKFSKEYLKRRTAILFGALAIYMVLWFFVFRRDGLVMLVSIVVFLVGIFGWVLTMDKKELNKNRLAVNSKPPAQSSASGPQARPVEPSPASRSYYGLTSIGSQAVYQGPLDEVPLDGKDMPALVDRLTAQAPSGRLLVLPQAGLLIVVGPSGNTSGQHFQTPLDSAGAASLMNSILAKGGKVNMLEQYGAIELVW